MTTNKAPIQPEAVAKHRPIERFQPGWWWKGDFGDGDVWVQVDLRVESEQISTGRRLVRILGTDPSKTGDDRDVQLVQERGFSVPSLTEAQGRRCGLTTGKGAES